VSKVSVTCDWVSAPPDQPVSGSGRRAVFDSKSSTHSPSRALPDCIAFFDRWKIRAAMLAP
jgi:hypothetical protein